MQGGLLGREGPANCCLGLAAGGRRGLKKERTLRGAFGGQQGGRELELPKLLVEVGILRQGARVVVIGAG